MTNDNVNQDKVMTQDKNNDKGQDNMTRQIH